MTTDTTTLIPATEAALRAGLSRERAIRAIQDGRADGGMVAGRWVVTPHGLEVLKQLASREASPAAVGGGR